MSRDKKVLYIISILIFAALPATLLLGMGSRRIVTACLMLPIAVAVCMLIKKRSSLSINKREVLLVLAVVGIIFVVLIQFTGLFFGSYKNPYFITTKTLLQAVIPITVVIITTEIVRSVLLAQKSRFVGIISYLFCVMAEVMVVSGVTQIITFNMFMDLVGLTLFPALSANVFYHFISKNYGALPNIVFRAIITLHTYFMPTQPAMSDALRACIMIVLPIVMLAFISAMFSKTQKTAKRRGQGVSAAATVLAVAFIVGIAMLISCQFRFGALVIATESMTGEINKGDMIIYEAYDGQRIEEGQVIVFRENKSKIVHRVVKIENIGGEIRYYTKGDANPNLDTGYITDADIVGLTDVKIAYIGYPTLWLREFISK